MIESMKKESMMTLRKSIITAVFKADIKKETGRINFIQGHFYKRSVHRITVHGEIMVCFKQLCYKSLHPDQHSRVS